MKIKNLTAVLAMAVLSSQTLALTAIIDIKGNVNEYISPVSLQNYESFALAQPIIGQVVIKNFEQYFGYDRSVPGFVGKTVTINPNDNEQVGFTIGSTKFPQPYFEGGSRFIKNDLFDKSKPACHYWEFGKKDGCSQATLNPEYRLLDTSGANFGKLLGNAELKIVNGELTSFTWSMDRTQGIETYDNDLKDHGVAFLMKKAMLNLSDFKFVKAEHENVYFSANQHVSIEVQEVPVPAAAWLFGSAMLGLFGVKRKK